MGSIPPEALEEASAKLQGEWETDTLPLTSSTLDSLLPGPPSGQRLGPKLLELVPMVSRFEDGTSVPEDPDFDRFPFQKPDNS